MRSRADSESLRVPQGPGASRESVVTVMNGPGRGHPLTGTRETWAASLALRKVLHNVASPAPNVNRPCTARELIKVFSLLSRAENRGNRDMEAHFRGVAWEGPLATGCQRRSSSSDAEREESSGNAGRLGVEPGDLKEMVPV